MRSPHLTVPNPLLIVQFQALHLAAQVRVQALHLSVLVLLLQVLMERDPCIKRGATIAALEEV